MNEPETARALYKKLLNLYPKSFKEQLGESMEQTFKDLYQERQTMRGLYGFLFWMFAETTIGIIQEHIALLRQGDYMKNILTNHNSAAITSFVLSLPLGLTFVAFMFEIDYLAEPLTALFTTNGSDLNGPGRIFIFGGLIILPVAFVLNLRPLLKRDEPEGKRKLYALNLIVGAVILLLIIVAWGGLLVEEIYCLRGIRCD